MNGYDLHRMRLNFRFENPDKCRSIHSELFMYIVDLWNRLGQKEKFGLPTEMTMSFLHIGSYNTYHKAYTDLVSRGFIKEIQKSTNQYSARVIAMSKIDKSTDKALDKATMKATDETTDETTDIIYKQLNNGTTKQETTSKVKEYNKSITKKHIHDDKITDAILNEGIMFEEFRKKYPRGTSNGVTKKIVLEYYKRASDSENEIIEQVKIINWAVELGIQEEKYTKSCNNWIIGFKPDPQVVIDKKVKDIVYKIREKNLDKDENIAKRLIDDFGRDIIMKYSREYHNEYKSVKLKLS